MELWDAYTRDGQRLGILLSREEPIPAGMYHLVCEVLVRHTDGSFLCMKRHPNKKAYPGALEATAGGSALAGETPPECIRRELLEETGLSCDDFTEVAAPIRDCEQAIFRTYVCTVDCDKNAITLQEGETVGYVWLSEAEFIDFVNSDDIIPTQKERFLPYYQQQGYLK